MRYLLAFLLVPSLAFGATVVLQGDAADSTLTYDDELRLRTTNGADSVNYGAITIMWFQQAGSDTSNQLVRFPNVHQCNSFDADDVDSAVLELRQNGGDDGVDSVKWYMYEVLKRWDAGTGSGAANCDWVSATYRADSCLNGAGSPCDASRAPDTAWGETGLLAGTDRASAVMDSAWLDSSNTDKWVAWTVSKSLCSTWVADSASNHGVLFEAPTGQGAFIRDCYPSEASGTTNDPRLTIYYTTREAVTGEILGAGVRIGP